MLFRSCSPEIVKLNIDPRLRWVCFTSFCDWFGKIAATLLTNHIDAKLKPLTTSSHALSRASGSSLVFNLNLIGSERYFSFLQIGLCNNFGFGFTTLNPKALHFERVFFLVGFIIP